MRHLIQTDIYLQYKMELAIHGMVDGPPGGLSVRERFDKLREYGDCIRSARFTSWETTFPSQWFLSRCQPFLFGSSVTYMVRSRGMDHMILLHTSPLTPLDQQRERRRMIPPATVPDRVVAVDVAQDLLIVSRRTTGDTWWVYSRSVDVFAVDDLASLGNSSSVYYHLSR